MNRGCYLEPSGFNPNKPCSIDNKTNILYVYDRGMCLKNEHQGTKRQPFGGDMTVKTILIVDDEAIWVKLLSRLFSYYGYTVVAASSCMQGLEALRQNRVDCAVLDFNLQDGSGAAICAAIREKGSGAKTPVIIFSADPDAEVCLSGIHRADMVIFKDTSLTELPRVLASLFQVRQLS